MSMSEKRTHKRVRVTMKVAYRDNDHTYKMGRVCDISKGGMYVQTGDVPEVDGYLIASLDAEDFGKIIWVQGQVAWKTRSGVGIKFTNTDEKGLNNLLSYRSVPF
ncbi:MAG TPA: PilZ domain-containing protein [Desulfomonilia bacterium]|nr:PilZ domain-containing protein [Desulfomonilia bacterium]